MKEKIEILKKYWNNPRSHALIVLGFYFIFFAVFIIFSSSLSKRNVETKKQIIEKDEYEFTLYINEEKITGEKSDDKIIFVYNNYLYKYENDLVEPDNFEYEEILRYLDIDNVKELEKTRERYSKTEFNDNTINEVYKISDSELTVAKKENKIIELILKTNENEYKIVYE